MGCPRGRSCRPPGCPVPAVWRTCRCSICRVECLERENVWLGGKHGLETAHRQCAPRRSAPVHAGHRPAPRSDEVLQKVALKYYEKFRIFVKILS
jgi:hypothetical protein